MSTRTLTFTNSRGGQIEFGNFFPYVMETVEGLSNKPSTVQTSKGFGQHGEYYFGTLDEMRVINATIKYNYASLAEDKTRQREILNVLNPRTGLGTLVYEDEYSKYTIDALVVQSPTIYPLKNIYTGKGFDVIFLCPKPDWLNFNPTQIKVVGLTGGLSFPLEFPISFADQGDNTVIEYEGDNPSPMIFEFRVASGGSTAVDPRIEDDDGNFIEVNRTINTGEKIIIDTNPDAPTIKFVDTGGVESDAWTDLVVGSTISAFQLEPGTNTLLFSATSGDPELFITYTEHYAGIK